MSLIPGSMRASGFCALLGLSLGLPAVASGQEHWRVNDAIISDEVTGSAGPVFVEQAPGADEQMPTLLAQADTGAAPPPNVDESALRYFARQGDTRRLEIEIARLRALYPTWTPPADPLATPANVDDRLEAVWMLYSQGRYGEARKAIAERQAEEPSWQPPADLLDRLVLAEARQRLINASQIEQYATVIRLGSENPHLLTCAEVDVLWRVAEAFAKTERPERARDAYSYVLMNCDNVEERLATIQNAASLLSQPLVAELLGLERFDANGVGEFASVYDNLARDALARAGDDAAVTVTPADLSRLQRLALEQGASSDARLLGWYYLRRENLVEAEKWFRMAVDREDSADGSEGLALTLIARGQHAEAEAQLYRWRGEDDNTRSVYFAAAADLLGTSPRPVLSPEVLERIVAEVASARNVATGQQLGWYARAWEQHETAGLWFSTALAWNPDDEPSAYGLALTRHVMGDTAGLAEIKRVWTGRSERIQEVGTGAVQVGDGRTVLPSPSTPTASARTQPVARQQEASQHPAARVAVERSQSRAAAAVEQSCNRHVDPQTLTPEAALRRGWCLMNANRPLEAAGSFDVALAGRSEQTRRDAAWGQSLAYLRAELVDEAAVAATSAPQDSYRAQELQIAILAQRAAAAHDRGRYVETLLALDQRAQIAPERIDLMVLRGYAYLNLRRLNDARRVFEAVAATGSTDGRRGLAELNNIVMPN